MGTKVAGMGKRKTVSIQFKIDLCFSLKLFLGWKKQKQKQTHFKFLTLSSKE
jgi:hypothetical protein